VHSYDTYLEDVIERCKNKLYEFSTSLCAWITNGVHWIGLELSDTPIFDGTGPIDTFLAQMEEAVSENQRV
jgi:hypothetical protein